jgi:hypothetical protein
MRNRQKKASSAQLFEYLKLFNHIVVVDEALAAQLPATEFELSFNQQGDIYVNRVPLRVNVKQRYDALVQR